MVRYAIQFAGHTAVVELISNEPGVLQIVPTLFNEHLVTPPAVTQPVQTIRAYADVEENSYGVQHLELGLQQTSDPHLFPLLLTQAITDYFVAQPYDGLLLHAAAVSKNGRAILMPGRSGQGKTTLLCWLLTQGFDYLSDEMVHLPARTTEIVALNRPLNIKRGAVPIIQGLMQANGQDRSEKIYKHSDYCLMPATVLSRRPSLQNSQLALIISPRFELDAPFSLAPLTKSQTVEILMNNFFRRHLAPKHGFSDCVYVARHIPAYQLTYSDFSQINGVVEELLS